MVWNLREMPILDMKIGNIIKSSSLALYEENRAIFISNVLQTFFSYNDKTEVDIKRYLKFPPYVFMHIMVIRNSFLLYFFIVRLLYSIWLLLSSVFHFHSKYWWNDWYTAFTFIQGCNCSNFLIDILSWSVLNLFGNLLLM